MSAGIEETETRFWEALRDKRQMVEICSLSEVKTGGKNGCKYCD